MDAFTATRLALGAGFLAVAAASDLRTRRVPSRLWVLLGGVGAVLLAGELLVRGAAWPAWSFLGSASLLFLAVFFGDPLFNEHGFRPRPARLVLFLAAAILFLFPLVANGASSLSPFEVQLATMPVMVLLYQGFYHVRLIHGGADAKGLMALTLLIPTYPETDPFPLITGEPTLQSVLQILFPFSFIVWVNAAIASVAVPLAIVLRNLARGDVAFPQMFLGYRASLAAVPPHAWLMERISPEGEHVLILFPRREGDRDEEIARLRAAGVTRVWITPKIPFLVPLLIGFALAFFAGNVLLAFLQALR